MRALARTSASSLHVCALREDGAVICWGRGGSRNHAHDGQLGYIGVTDDVGDDEPAGTFGPVDVGEPSVFVAVGGNGFEAATCAIGVSGKLHCWGAASLTGYGDGVDRGAVPGTMPPGDVPLE